MTVTQTILAQWDDLSPSAQSHILATRRPLLNRWYCIDSDCGIVDTITADDAADALDSFSDTYDRGMYPDAEGTVYIDILVRNTITGEEESGTITLDEPEPECSAGEHNWRSPYSVVGGLRENPGVFGAGAGVRITNVCSHCGAYRTILTHAQRRDTGEYIGEQVSYSEADEDSIEWIRRRARPEIERVLDNMDDVVEYKDGTLDVLTVVTVLRDGADIDDVVEALAAALPDHTVENVSSWRSDRQIEISRPEIG